MNGYPVRVTAQREDRLSRWLWLVKWLLLIPHFIVLAFLWVALVVCVLIAYVAVLITGRYPHPMYSFNLGVLRWSWRVGYYGYQVLGTDRYPPFTLADVPDYPARLDVEYRPRPRRWLPLVAWLFAIPHAIILGALTTPYRDDDSMATSPSVVGAAVFVIGLWLLFAGRHLVGLYSLLVGVARWSYRVTGYVALLTDAYPPFRLDQGDAEPEGGPDDRWDRGAAALVPTAPAAGTGGGSAGYVVALVAGVLAFVVGLGLGAGGTALLVLNGNRGADGYISSRLRDVSSPTAAITAEEIEVQAGDAWSRGLAEFGDVRITAESTDGAPLFLGVAPQSDVDRWLTGTAHDRLVSAYGPGDTRYDRASGAMRAVAPPSEQNFWLAQATASGTVVLDWRVTNGEFAVVLTNADGTPGVVARVRAATQVPNLAPLGWGLLGAGVASVVVGIVLIYLGAAGLGRRHAPGAGAPDAHGAPPGWTGPRGTPESPG